MPLSMCDTGRFGRYSRSYWGPILQRWILQTLSLYGDSGGHPPLAVWPDQHAVFAHMRSREHGLSIVPRPWLLRPSAWTDT